MKNSKKPAEAPTTNPEQLSPKSRHRLTKAMAKLLISAGAISSPFVGTAMIVEKTMNPVAATIGFKYGVQANILGEDFCPPAPNESKRAEIKTNIENALTNPDAIAARLRAEAKGLHFTNPKETFSRLNSVQNASEATAVISDYTKASFGFDVKLDVPHDSLSSREGMASYKQRLFMFALTMSRLPNELVRGTGAVSLTIKQSLDDGKTADGAGSAGQFHPLQKNSGHGTVDIELGYISVPRVVLHEFLGHGINNNVCHGYYEKDGGFTQFNPKGFVYSDGNKNRPDYDSTVSSSAYGTTDVTEDDAEMVTRFFIGAPDGSLMTYPDGQPIADKMAVVLDRMENIAPGSVDYLEAMRPVFAEIQKDAYTTSSYR